MRATLETLRDDEFITEDVYIAALKIAAVVTDAPTIFTHSPNSVVFCWEGEITKYATITSTHVSILKSNPAKILARYKMTLEEALRMEFNNEKI